MRRFAPLCLLAVVACGQAAHQPGQAEPGDAPGGRGGEVTPGGDGSTVGGASSSEAGGEGPSFPVAGSSQLPGAGKPPVGSGGATDDEPLRAGTRYCTSEQDCLGLECVGYGASQAAICSSNCQDNYDCEVGLICFGTADLAPLCLQPCQSAEDCAYGFDCVHYLDQATLCVPSPWTEAIMHAMP